MNLVTLDLVSPKGAWLFEPQVGMRGDAMRCRPLQHLLDVFLQVWWFWWQSVGVACGDGTGVGLIWSCFAMGTCRCVWCGFGLVE